MTLVSCNPPPTHPAERQHDGHLRRSEELVDSLQGPQASRAILRMLLPVKADTRKNVEGNITALDLPLTQPSCQHYLTHASIDSLIHSLPHSFIHSQGLIFHARSDFKVKIRAVSC